MMTRGTKLLYMLGLYDICFEGTHPIRFSNKYYITNPSILHFHYPWPLEKK